MHVLAKNGELFGQVAVQFRQFPETWLVINTALVPGLVRVRAAAYNSNIQLVCAFDQGIAYLCQLPQHFRWRLANPG